MGVLIVGWLAATGVFWAVAMVVMYRRQISRRGYRDVGAEYDDAEDAACAGMLMWVLTGWLPCFVWLNLY